MVVHKCMHYMDSLYHLVMWYERGTSVDVFPLRNEHCYYVLIDTVKLL